jgi:hypothetical protein
LAPEKRTTLPHFSVSAADELAEIGRRAATIVSNGFD